MWLIAVHQTLSKRYIDCVRFIIQPASEPASIDHLTLKWWLRYIVFVLIVLIQFELEKILKFSFVEVHINKKITMQNANSSTTCCCCVNLKTGGLLIGFTGLICNVFEVMFWNDTAIMNYVSRKLTIWDFFFFFLWILITLQFVLH